MPPKKQAMPYEVTEMKRRLAISLAFVLAATMSAYAADSTSGWSQNLAKWRAEHETEIKSPDGWLTVVGLKWLPAGVNTVGATADNTAQIEDIGASHLLVLRNQENHILLEKPKDGFPAGLTLDGKPAQAAELGFDGRKTSVLRYGSFTLTVIHRGDRLGLRIKNSQSAALTNFRGLRWYQPNPAYRIHARWVPYAEPKTVTIHNVVNTTSTAIVPGEAQFELDGKTVALLPVVQSLSDKTLFFVLRDATSETTTYQASRFLDTTLPDHGLDKPGTLVLDFNELVNPPCAFTPYATCPLPLEQNRLSIALPAGELRYEHE